MISKQIPFDAKLAMKAWKESSNAKVYYRLYTRDGLPIYPLKLVKNGDFCFFGETSGMFDPKGFHWSAWTAQGHYDGDDIISNKDLELYKVNEYD